MKVQRVAMFGLDFPNIVNQLLGLRDGFRQLGIEVLTAWPHPNALTLENVLDSFRPDFVFEINRSRNQIRDCDEKFIHVCWMQDIQSLGQRLDVDFGGSDLSYFIVPPSALGYDAGLNGSVRHLFPGTSPDNFVIAVEHPVFDFSFIGQIFAPISEELRSKPITVKDIECGTFGGLVDLFDKKGLRISAHGLDHMASALVEYIRQWCPTADASMINPAIRNLCDEYLPRLRERTRLLDEIMKISTKVGFFGTGPWHKWPQYHPHFGGYVNRQSKLAMIYRRTRVNLHNGGIGIHMRVLDCMATGSAIMVSKNSWEGTEFGTDWYFEPNLHYLAYDFDNLSHVAAEALADEPRRRKIGTAAAAVVRAQHTWRHRAAQIIADLKIL